MGAQHRTRLEGGMVISAAPDVPKSFIIRKLPTKCDTGLNGSDRHSIPGWLPGIVSDTSSRVFSNLPAHSIQWRPQIRFPGFHVVFQPSAIWFRRG
jgi:hypothetical protein